jgi:hypothetical protein
MNSSVQKTPRKRRVVWIITVVAVLIAAVGLFWRAEPRPSASQSAITNGLSVVGSAASNSSLQPPSKATTALGQGNSQQSTSSGLAQTIRETLVQLRAETDPEKSRLLLEALRQQLVEANAKAESVEAILGFLRSGQDAATGLAFRVGPKHALAESPTLRTALLDWLGQLDPAAAADYAVQVFEAMASPEEYALALRNFAQGRPEQRDELRNHFNRLLTHAPWSNPPAAGYLESFDVVPHLADPTFVNPLGALLAPSSQPSLRHASLVALDRLVLANPPGALTEMLNGQALTDQPLVRASFLARVDIREPGQRELVERYLLEPSLSDRELDKFVHLFPNANRFVSHNLLTESGGRPLADLAVLDATALEQVRAWQAQPRFARLQTPLKELENRLREHVESARQGGYLPAK